MNLGEIKTLCASWLDDPNYGYFTQAQLLVFINNAQKEAQKQLLQSGENWYVKTVTTSTVASQSDYVLPSDFYRLNRLELVYSGTPCTSAETETLDPITLMQQDLFPAAPTTPAAYFLKKDRLVLVPPPDLSTYSIRLWYSYKVNDLVADTDVPDIPTQYQEYIAVLATLDGFLKDSRDPSTLMAKKEMYLDMMKKDSEARRVDASRAVVTSRSEETNFFF